MHVKSSKSIYVYQLKIEKNHLDKCILLKYNLA